MHPHGRYLQELGLKYETHSFDMSKEEHKAEAYLKVGHRMKECITTVYQPTACLLAHPAGTHCTSCTYTFVPVVFSLC